MRAELEDSSPVASAPMISLAEGFYEPRPWLERLSLRTVAVMSPEAIGAPGTREGDERTGAPPPVPSRSSAAAPGTPPKRTPTGPVPPLRRAATGQHGTVSAGGAPPPLRAGARSTGATPPLTAMDAMVMAPLSGAELVGPNGVLKAADLPPEVTRDETLARADELSDIMSDILATEEQEQTRRRVVGQTRISNDAWHREIFEDADDWLAFQPAGRQRNVARELQFVHQQVKLRMDFEVLDVGCADGAHSVELASSGCRTTGLDLSRSLLERGLAAANRRGVAVRFVEADMREMNFERRFDVVLCLGSTFGYFDDAENLKVLRNMARALKVGGHMVLDVLNRDWAVQAAPMRQWWEGAERRVIEDTGFDYGASRLCVQRSILREGHPNWEQYISMRTYSVHELTSLLHVSGMRVVSISGDIAHPGLYLGPTNRRLLIHAIRDRAV